MEYFVELNLFPGVHLIIGAVRISIIALRIHTDGLVRLSHYKMYYYLNGTKSTLTGRI